MDERLRSQPVAYCVAVLGTDFSVLLRAALFCFAGDAATLIVFFPAVILSAWTGGAPPGLLATSLVCSG